MSKQLIATIYEKIGNYFLNHSSEKYRLESMIIGLEKSCSELKRTLSIIESKNESYLERIKVDGKRFDDLQTAYTELQFKNSVNDTLINDLTKIIEEQYKPKISNLEGEVDKLAKDLSEVNGKLKDVTSESEKWQALFKTEATKSSDLATFNSELTKRLSNYEEPPPLQISTEPEDVKYKVIQYKGIMGYLIEEGDFKDVIFIPGGKIEMDEYNRLCFKHPFKILRSPDYTKDLIDHKPAEFFRVAASIVFDHIEKDQESGDFIDGIPFDDTVETIVDEDSGKPIEP